MEYVFDDCKRNQRIKNLENGYFDYKVAVDVLFNSNACWKKEYYIFKNFNQW